MTNSYKIKYGGPELPYDTVAGIKLFADETIEYYLKRKF